MILANCERSNSTIGLNSNFDVTSQNPISSWRPPKHPFADPQQNLGSGLLTAGIGMGEHSEGSHQNGINRTNPTHRQNTEHP